MTITKKSTLNPLNQYPVQAPPLNGAMVGKDGTIDPAWARSMNQIFAKNLAMGAVTSTVSATLVPGTTVAHTDDAYNGYTLGQIVEILQILGILA